MKIEFDGVSWVLYSIGCILISVSIGMFNLTIEAFLAPLGVSFIIAAIVYSILNS